MFTFLPSLIDASRAAWCGVPLEMMEGTIPIGGTKGLSTRPRCITLITQLNRIYTDYGTGGLTVVVPNYILPEDYEF
jgi:hypothetical protein